MGTEILLPYDMLRSPQAALHLPHRKRFSKPELKKRSSAVPRTGRLMCRAGVLGPPPANLRGETYAGPAFSASPSPGELPLPTFNSKKIVDDVSRLSATMDLRRILRLD